MGLTRLRLGEIGRMALVRDDVKRTKIVNATASTNGAVKVTMGKGFRFGGSVVRSTEAAVA